LHGMRGRRTDFHCAPACVVDRNGADWPAPAPCMAIRAAFAKPCSIDYRCACRAALVECSTNGNHARQLRVHRVLPGSFSGLWTRRICDLAILLSQSLGELTLI